MKNEREEAARILLDAGWSPETRRCKAIIRERDTYRYTGRTKSGFEIHYRKRQCKRRARFGDLCSQHARLGRRRRGDD